jgi:hypothetical protein
MSRAASVLIGRTFAMASCQLVGTSSTSVFNCGIASIYVGDTANPLIRQIATQAAPTARD